MNDEPTDLHSLRDEIQALRHDVAAVPGKLDAHRDAYEKRAAAANRKADRATFLSWLTIAALVVVVGGLVVVKAGLDRMNAERAQRTITACEQQALIATQNNAQDDVILDLFADLIAGDDDPSTSEFLAPYVEAIRANRNLVRACDPESIEAYYDSNGEDGYLP